MGKICAENREEKKVQNSYSLSRVDFRVPVYVPYLNVPLFYFSLVFEGFFAFCFVSFSFFSMYLLCCLN
jgi:hypothetical protein